MKKLKTIIAAILLAMCCVNAHATVTITAPEKPEGIVDTIVSGETYLLYNIERNQFFDAEDNNYKTGVWGEKSHPLLVEKHDNEYWTFLYKSENGTGDRYIENYYREFQGSSGSIRSYSYYIIEPFEDAFRFKTAPTNSRYYGEDSWMGYNPSEDSRYILWNGTSATVWAFIPANDEDALKYWLQKVLYDAIVAADAKGYPIRYYENIYNNGTNEDIVKATRELNTIEEYSAGAQCIVPDWNDYPIQFYSEDFGGYYDYAIRRAVFGANTYGQTKTMSANVVITEPSTLVMNIHSDNEDHQRVLFPIDVYIDGEKIYSYTGDLYLQYWTQYRHNSYTDQNTTSSSSGYRRIFTELPEPGEHRIDVVFTNNMNDNNSHAIAFNTFGIEKTPTITVNVAKEGQLGDEVLRAMDNHPNISETNIRNVRKLVVSGKLNDTDIDLIKSMTSLFTLDLADTNIKTIEYNQFCRTENSHLAFFHDIVLPKGLTRIGDRAFQHSYVENVDIPEGVEYIGYNAFADTYIHKAIMPNVTTIGEYAFFNCPHLKEVKTVKLESVGRKAFQYNTNLEKVELCGTYTTLPWAVFDSNTSLKDIVVEDSIVSIEKYAFYNCYNVPLFKLSQHLKTIGLQAFGHCNVSGELPNSITSIGNQVFIYCKIHSNDSILHLPANATYGSEVFRYSDVKNVIVPDGYYSLTPSLMFANCDSLKSVKFLSPTKTTVATNFVEGLNKKDLKILVPQHLNYTYQLDNYWMDFTIVPFSTTELDSIVIRQDLALSQHDRFEGTPDLAIEKGVQFELEGAAGMDLKSITLSSDLEANNYAQITSGTDQVSINGLASERLYTKANKWYFMSLPFDCNLASTVNENGGRYAIRYYDGASRAAELYPELIDDGETEVYLYNVDARAYIVYGNEYGTRASYSPTNKSRFKIINNGNGTWTLKNYVNGYFQSMFTSGSAVWLDNNNGANANNWVITPMGNGKYEITNTGIEGAKLGWMLGSTDTRLYINNNVNATTWAFVTSDVHNANWKNYDCSKDIVPAGTGFIFMTSQDSWTRFYSVDNGTKNRVFENAENENNEFHYELQKHPSENAANRGWNLVGNPYPNYYNIHRISFAAPITLWNGTTYQAYSLRDDDIAIKPNQAIFVQCPEETSEISFPAAGRQLTSVITDQANVPSRRDAAAIRERQIINLALMPDSEEAEATADHTRIVLNEAASLSYELACDASKFMSMDNQVQQLYTLGGNGIKYAINERPAADGQVALGIYIPTDGQYKMQLQRNDAETVLLTDTETGFTTELSNGEYCFTAKAGTHDQRFILTVEPKRAPEATAIESLADEHRHNGMQIYTIDGRRTDNMLHPGTYILRNGDTVRKVLVK